MKRNVDLATQFPLQDVTRVNKPASQSELLSQNNGMIQDETSTLLLNLLKDPSVTVNFLKSISSMEALIRLLPANNNPFTQEIEQMFGQMLVPSDQIAGEMQKQENMSTFFKGPLFEMLREALRQNPAQNELRGATVSFLKALTLFYTQREALGSVANSLKFLSESLFASKGLSQKLEELAGKYRAEDAPENFSQLRQETFALLKEVEESILFSEKSEKIVKMIIYNLSRYNDNGDFLQESVSRLLTQLHGDEAREHFLSNLEGFMEQVKEPPQREPSAMDALTRILTKQAGNEELMSLNSDKIETIIHSLLSAPCNFTPLLHFVLPVQYYDIQSFAEIWINPNGEEDRSDDKADRADCIHMLLVFDIEGMGKFEAELYTLGKKVELSLRCPPNYCRIFRNAVGRIERCINATSYRFEKIRVDPLERPNSLMDVFKSLPYKRTGVNVKI